jgi:hypothetical protein
VARGSGPAEAEVVEEAEEAAVGAEAVEVAAEAVVAAGAVEAAAVHRSACS